MKKSIFTSLCLIFTMTQCSTNLNLPNNYTALRYSTIYEENNICPFSFRNLQTDDRVSLSIQGKSILKNFSPKDTSIKPTYIHCSDSSCYDYDLLIWIPRCSRKISACFLKDHSDHSIVANNVHSKNNAFEYVLTINNKIDQEIIEFDEQQHHHIIYDYFKTEDTLYYRHYNGIYFYED